MAEAMRVLIIDDEDDLVEMLRLRLESLGYSVRSASDGAKGIEAASEFKPHVILLDNLMPDMEGVEVSQRLRADPGLADTRIVLMTAGSPTKSAARAKDAACDDLILKPYDYDEVIRKIAGASGPGRQSHAQGA